MSQSQRSNIKDLVFEIKGIDEQGTFTGAASIYGALDLVNDIVEKGAFTKTISDNAGRVPMLWQHKTDELIGHMVLQDSDEKLMVTGNINLGVSRGQEAYALLKNGDIRGLSIGYQAVKKEFKNGVRYLKEVKLLEVSLVTFPALPSALISDVKSERKADFSTELQNAQTYSLQWIMLDSLVTALRSFVSDAFYEGELKRDEVILRSMESIDQFRDSYGEYLPKLLDLYNIKSQIDADRKAGRRLSDVSRAAIGEAVASLQALLGEEAASSTDSASEDTDTSAPEAASKSNEPEALHSLVTDFTTKWKSQLAAA